jgi:hypothetical protein
VAEESMRSDERDAEAPVAGPFIEEALICGFQIPEHGPNRTVSMSDAAAALAETGAVTWLHFRLANARAETFFHTSGLVPESLRDRIRVRDRRNIVEATDDGLIVVSGDLSFDHAADPGETTDVWAYATRRYLVTARTTRS